MASKYAFSKTIKELRFLHCQTSEHSNAVRYDHCPPNKTPKISWDRRGIARAQIADEAF